MAVLLVLALYTMVDRPLISLLVEPLKADLALNDLQIGLVQGLSVALFAAFAGYPIGWLADRFDRRLVLCGCILVWSAALAAAGLAGSFTSLFAASALVGAGEAGVLPILYAMVPLLFRGETRYLANSTLVVGGRLGMGLIIALCGWIVVSVDMWKAWLPASMQGLADWRLAMLASALPGILLVPLVWLLLPRSRTDAAPTAPGVVPAADARVLPYLRRHRVAFLSFYSGVAALSFAATCMLTFAPVIAIRQMGATALEAGSGVGSATFAATVTGFLIASAVYRGARGRTGGQLPVQMMCVAALLAAVPAAALASSSGAMMLYIWVWAFVTATMCGTLFFPTVVQDISPSRMRARAVSIMITLNIVIGSLGPVIVGAISDRLADRPDGLLMATAGVSSIAMLLSAILLVPLVSRYVDTVAAARRHERVSGP